MTFGYLLYTFARHKIMKILFALVCSVLLGSFSTSYALDISSQEKCRQAVITNLPNIPGWCSPAKASAIMELIFRVKPSVCVELGVFAGASLYPTAAALKQNGEGVVYAVDAWSNLECYKHLPAGNSHKDYWKQIDLNAMHNYFLQLLKSEELQDQCIVIKNTFANAAPLIDPIDILHIDGDHYDESAYPIVLRYVPKVKVGGYIWFNGWGTSPKAFEYIKRTCYIVKVIDEGQCLLFEKKFPDSAEQTR